MSGGVQDPNPAPTGSPKRPLWARIPFLGCILGVLGSVPQDVVRQPFRVGCDPHTSRALKFRRGCGWAGDRGRRTGRVVPLVGPDVLVEAQCSRHFMSAPRVGAVEHIVVPWVQHCDGRRSNCGRTVVEGWVSTRADVRGGSESHIDITYGTPVYFVDNLDGV